MERRLVRGAFSVEKPLPLSVMNFASSSFWLSLVPALLLLAAGNFLLRRRDTARTRFQKLWLAVVGLGLLGMASVETLLVFGGVLVVAWVGCAWGMRLSARGRKMCLAVLAPLLLLPLFVYKYSHFVVNDLLGQNIDTLRHLLIPIGISFYSFQILGFCIDTLLRGKPLPAFVDYLNFCAFFPQIVAGPIERRDALLPQMQAPDLRFCSQRLSAGIPYIILGLFFKLALADNLAAAFCRNYAGGNALTLWANNLLFSFRIYFDFAGYGMLAYGLASCLGVKITLNFLSPYTVRNMTEFWRSWNISLYAWLRDYIYKPIGGGRTRFWAFNILIVFVISGIWHGAGWNFLLWGVLTGAFLLGHRLFRCCGLHLPGLIAWALTMGLMAGVWMFFYETDISTLLRDLKLLVTPGAYQPAGFVGELVAREWYGTMVLPFLGLSAAVVGVEALSRRLRHDPYALFVSPIGCGIMVYLMVLLNNSQQTPFIYFSF